MNHEIILSKSTESKLKAYLKNMPNSLVIVAPKYSGKKYLMQYIAKSIVGSKNINENVFYIKKEEDKINIGIDQIRYVKDKLKLKNHNNRIVMISDAEELSDPAQNSLLKILEEPPERTYFIFTISNINSLLETIKSRSVIWNIVNPSAREIENIFNPNNDELLSKYILMANNRIGMLNRIMDGSDDKIIGYFDIAKEIFKSNELDRLLILKRVDIDRESIKRLIDVLQIVCKSALESTIQKKSSTDKTFFWYTKLLNVTKAKDEIYKNVQPKLVIAKLILMI